MYVCLSLVDINSLEGEHCSHLKRAQGGLRQTEGINTECYYYLYLSLAVKGSQFLGEKQEHSRVHTSIHDIVETHCYVLMPKGGTQMHRLTSGVT